MKEQLVPSEAVGIGKQSPPDAQLIQGSLTPQSSLGLKGNSQGMRIPPVILVGFRDWAYTHDDS